MVVAVAWAVVLAPTCHANPDAKRLYDDLLSSYNRLIRPVGNNSDRLTVKLGLKLSQLIDVVSTAPQGSPRPLPTLRGAPQRPQSLAAAPGTRWGREGRLGATLGAGQRWAESLVVASQLSTRLLPQASPLARRRRCGRPRILTGCPLILPPLLLLRPYPKPAHPSCLLCRACRGQHGANGGIKTS